MHVCMYVCMYVFTYVWSNVYILDILYIRVLEYFIYSRYCIYTLHYIIYSFIYTSIYIFLIFFQEKNNKL